MEGSEACNSIIAQTERVKNPAEHRANLIMGPGQKCRINRNENRVEQTGAGAAAMEVGTLPCNYGAADNENTTNHEWGAKIKQIERYNY